jgi:UDP-3-O-[3-hydroxymyristoyl] glucosamine N-acyltransferase
MPSLAQIIAAIGEPAAAIDEAVIAGVGTLDNARATHITFLANRKYASQVATTGAGAIILAPADKDLSALPRIITANPYAYFAQVAAWFNPAPKVGEGIHPTAVVDASAIVHPTASIGPQCSVGAGAHIAAGAVLEAQVYVGSGAKVGEGSRLNARVVLQHGCCIGKRGIVHSGAVIGADGFGFAPVDGRWLKIPQVGRVVIGDDVEIGANTTIDRGAVDDTVIEDGVKLDNQIQIGHNVRVGAHTAMAGCVGVAGSANIGKNCMVGGGTVILGHLKIADGVTIQAMSLVTRSITQAGVYSSALPVMPQDDWLKAAAQLRRMGKK